MNIIMSKNNFDGYDAPAYIPPYILNDNELLSKFMGLIETNPDDAYKLLNVFTKEKRNDTIIRNVLIVIIIILILFGIGYFVVYPYIKNKKEKKEENK